MQNKHSIKQNKQSGGLFRVLLLVIFGAAVVWFVSGCSYHPECDQTQHGRGNTPAACKSLTYQVGG